MPGAGPARSALRRLSALTLSALTPAALTLTALTLTALTLAVMTLAAPPAEARITFNRRALEPLGEADLPLPPPPPPGQPPAGPPAPGVPMPGAPHQLPPPPPPVPSPARPGLPPIGTVPPVPALPPPIVVPTRPPPPAAPVPVEPDAPGRATPIPDGLRLTFGPGLATMNPDSEAALRDFARQAPPGSRFEILAHAAGNPDDPSTPRRLALSRALAVRGVLLAAGIASPRILVRALGPDTGSGLPADRADLKRLPPAAP